MTSIKERKPYFLLDSRAGLLAIQDPSVSLYEFEEDPERFILLAGTAKECCEAANKGDYGDLCVVSDSDFMVKFEWLCKGDKWEPTKY